MATAELRSQLNMFKYFQKAKKEGWAIGQFHAANLETLQAIINAAQKLKSPVIIGTSEGESKFIGLRKIACLVSSYKKETGLPIFLNLDHGKDLGYIRKAIDAGYDSVHFDGSKLSLDENIKRTKEVLEYARKKKVLVEGEVGVIGDAEKTKEVLTKPEDALKFVKSTKVDNLAVGVGNMHGIKASGINPHLNLKRLREISRKVKSAGLVLHGGSGTPSKDVKEAIKLGIVKVNINTELRLAYTKGLKKVLKSKEIVPYKYMPEVINSIQKIVEEKIKLFGSNNKC